ncbi:zinc-binding dehydrogenase [Seiridium cupressi]
MTALSRASNPSDLFVSHTSWTPGLEGEPVVVTAFSAVLKSDNARFKPGDMVTGLSPAGEYAAIPAELLWWTRLVPVPPPGVDFGVLGSPQGIGDIGAFGTMLVSAASGGMGQIVGQMAKMDGMKVVGSTGSPEKASFIVEELGFDGAWNCKTDPTTDVLTRLAPGERVGEGKIKTREEVVSGMDNAPAALVQMLKGYKFGKMMLKIE